MHETQSHRRRCLFLIFFLLLYLSSVIFLLISFIFSQQTSPQSTDTTAVPVHDNGPSENLDMKAFHNAIVGDNLQDSLKSSKNRQRVSCRPSPVVHKEKENRRHTTQGNHSTNNNNNNYDTDDQTDQMMDMLVKSATSTEKRTRIRTNRAKEGKTNRKSGNYRFIARVVSWMVY